LNAVLPAASIGPRVVSQEEILEMVDEWLYTFDEDDDSFLAGSELEGLLKQLRQGSSVTGDAAAALTPQLLMTQVRSVCPAACVLRRKKTVSHCIRPPPPSQVDGDGDGLANRAELIDILRRMKGFDAGHIQRSEANKPSGDALGVDEQTYGKSHAERMAAKKKKRKRKKPKAAKDEV
jgi:hypothetical protein